MTEHRKYEPPGWVEKMSNEEMAELIADALHMAQLLGKGDVQRAVLIIKEEIDARKAIGDF